MIAANIDRVFVVTSANRDFNLRRLERYVAAVWDGGAEPIVVINKSDLTDDPDQYVARAAEVMVQALAVSAVEEAGLEPLAPFLEAGRTIALVGSSGVGKSTVINRLLGRELLATQAVRERDQKGRHTTMHRELVLLPGNRGMLIDTPGMREFGLWIDSAGVSSAFPDIEELATSCRFRDCSHQEEPGCAVRGQVQPKRLASYRKLLREQAYASEQREQMRRDKEAWHRQIRLQIRQRRRGPDGGKLR